MCKICLLQVQINLLLTDNDGKIYNENILINKRIIESLKYIKSTRYAKI